MRRLLPWLLAGASWFVGGSFAAAEGARAHLTWQRPVGSLCPSEHVLMGDAEQLAERRLFTSTAEADILVDGRIVETDSGVTARLEARTRDDALLGRRELYAPPGQCASLRRSLALVLLMLLERAESPQADASQRRDAQAWAGGGLLLGTLPRAAPGLNAGLGLTWGGRFQLRAEASYWLPRSSETSDGEGAKLQAWGLGLAGCPRVERGTGELRLWACGGAQLGALIADPTLLDGAGRQTRLLAQLTLELRLAVRLSQRTSLELSLGPVASLSRPRVFFRRADGATVKVAQPTPLGAIFRLSFVVQGL